MRLLLPLFVIWLGLAACTQNQGNEAAQATQEAEIVAEPQTLVENSLERAEMHLDALEDSLEQATGEAREELRPIVEELRREGAELAVEVKELEYEDPATFQEAQDDLLRRINDLEADITRARLTTVESIGALERAVKRQLNRADVRIDSLDKQRTKFEGAAGEVYEDLLRQARAERDTLAGYFERLESAADEEFEAMQSDVADASASLERTLRLAANDVDEMAQGLTE